MARGKAKGSPKTGGRVAGTANHNTTQLKDMILGALSDVGGQAYLARQAEDNPGPFMTLVGRVLPRDVNATLDMKLNIAEELDKLKFLINAASRD